MAIRVAPLACAAALALVAFNSGAAQQLTFRTGVRTVAVYATVSDREGRLVPNLERDAFRVLDNGRPTDLTVFSNQAQPITVAVMLDMSGSMGVRLMRVRQSTERFIDAIAPGDRARLGTFGWEVAISPVLTDDKAQLRRVLQEELWPGGPTPLWRALLAAMTSLESERGRRVVLVLTDGDDNDQYQVSRPTAAEVRRRAVGGAFMVYAIGTERSQRTATLASYDDSGMESPRKVRPTGLALGGLSEEMVKVVEETGGGHFELQSDAGLEETFARVAEELRHQYLLGFAPETLDGKVHELDVQVKVPGCRARARKSYVAQGER
jgi:Ca-activated chloride channel family protein